MTRSWLSATSTGVRITVQITPNAKKNEITGVLEDALKIRLQAQPIEGKANEALARFLADVLDVPKSAVAIVHGQTSKRKIIDIVASLDEEQVKRVLLPSGN